MTNLVVVTRSIAFGDGVGGMERAASDHVRAMVDHGMHVTLVAPTSPSGELPPGLGIEVVAWPTPPLLARVLFAASYVVWTRRVRRRLAQMPFDVVHFHGASVGAVDASTRRRAVANPHGMEEFGKAGWGRRVLRAPTRWLSRRAAGCAAVISTDISISPEVVGNLGVPEERVVLVPNAVNVDRLREQARGARPFDHYAIVSLGRLVPNKGHDLLLAALQDERVQQALPAGWTWHHFGSGPAAGRLAAQAATALPVNLRMHAGASDAEVQRAVAVADVFIQPSRYEGSSLTVLEAMTHGTTVIATPVGGIPDKIRHGRTGLLTRDVSKEAIAQALLDQVRAPQSFADDAREAVEAEFSWATAARRYAATYEKVISGGE